MALLAGACAAWLIAPLVLAQGLVAIPAYEARVIDLTGTLTAEQQGALEGRLAEFEARKGSQIAVLMLPSTKPEDIAQFGIRLADAWKPGRAKVDDGAILIVAKDDRRLRIEVGYGLEGVLPDATSKRIIEETIKPLFKQNDFYGGISAGLDRMMQVVDGEPLPPPDPSWERTGSILELLPFLFVAVLIGSVILRSIFGRALGSLLTGGATGMLVWLVSSILGISIAAGLLALFFSLVMSSLGGGRWSSSPHRGGWRGGGWGGGATDQAEKEQG
ncbi:MAG TPA: YgcG family protein, partial [Steroidobacteraceae bacterium]|nr:YgcG family protein [Steroidobacteraceae bacterium]